MKTRFVDRPGTLVKTFHPSGSTLNESKSYSQEQVSPGAMLRNDPKYRKLPATWTYRVYNRVALNDYEAGDKPSHKIFNANGTKRMDAIGCYGIHIPDPTPADFDNSSVLNQALTRMNDAVRGSLDLSIALAESGKTAEMLKSTGKFVSFARGNKPRGGYPVLPRVGLLRRASDVTHALANGYLQYKYGWRQLMSDVFNVADESIRLTLNQLQKFSATAKITNESGYKFVTSINGESSVPVTIHRNVIRKARYCVSLMLPSSSFDIARWTSLNPISLAWELIPYSFVVDWFVDIGSTLRNVETACYYNAQFRSGYRSSLSVHLYDASVDGYTNISPFDFSKSMISGLQGSMKCVDFRRDVLSSYPTPSIPSFKVDLGASQLTSAAALLRQLLRKA